MHIKYNLSALLIITACFPSKPNELLGESDRPLDPTTSGEVGFVDSGTVDTALDAEMPPELFVDADSIFIIEANSPPEPDSTLTLSVDESKILLVEHIFEWDSTTITDIQVTQPDASTIDFDYGSSGETSIWLTIQYSMDISILEDGTYSVTAEGDQGEFVLD